MISIDFQLRRGLLVVETLALALRVLADRLEHGERVPSLTGLFADAWTTRPNTGATRWRHSSPCDSG